MHMDSHVISSGVTRMVMVILDKQLCGFWWFSSILNMVITTLNDMIIITVKCIYGVLSWCLYFFIQVFKNTVLEQPFVFVRYI